MDGSTCAATVGAGRRGCCSGALSARVRRRAGIYRYIRASTIARAAAATTSAVTAASAFNATFTTAAVPAAVSAAVVTTIAAVVHSVSAACVGVQPDQVPDGPRYRHAGRAISLDGAPVFGSPGWSNVDDGRHGAGIDVEYA